MVPIRTERGQIRRVIVVGAGIAGIFTTLSLCAAGVPVLLVTAVPPRRSHSGSDQAGIFRGNANSDAARSHLESTVTSGGFLGDTALLRSMFDAAPRLVETLASSGVPFERDAQGKIALGRAAGTPHAVAAYAGARTGQQVLHALEARLQREATTPLTDEHGTTVPGEARVAVLLGWEVLSLVLDDGGAAVGVVAQDLRTMAVKALRGDAVCIATGGATLLFSASTGSASCTGSALAALARQGAVMANPEFVEWHPFSVAGADKHRGMGERCVALGARLWTPRDPSDPRLPAAVPERERRYPLEERFPETGNRSSWSLAARTLYGADSTNDAAPRIYLDMTHLSEGALGHHVAPSRDNALRVSGADLWRSPVPVTCAAHYTLGGLWTDYEAHPERGVVRASARNQATNLPGVFAVGEASYQVHGAGLVGANTMLSHLYGAELAAAAIETYRGNLTRSAFDLPGSIFERAEAREIASYERLFTQGESASIADPRSVMRELQAAMWTSAGPRRNKDGLETLLADIDSLAERARSLWLSDRGSRSNQIAPLARAVGGMLTLARITAASALARTESRGTHFRADCPELAPAWQRKTLVRLGQDEQVELVREFSYENIGKTISASDRVDPVD